MSQNIGEKDIDGNSVCYRSEKIPTDQPATTPISDNNELPQRNAFWIILAASMHSGKKCKENAHAVLGATIERNVQSSAVSARATKSLLRAARVTLKLS